MSEGNGSAATGGFKRRHIVLTSHPSRSGLKGAPIDWGDGDPLKRGAIVATVSDPNHRNAIGTHSGSYAVYRALAVASGVLQADHRPDFTNTSPTIAIGPHPSWADPAKIVSLDPFGALVPAPAGRRHRHSPHDRRYPRPHSNAGAA